MCLLFFLVRSGGGTSGLLEVSGEFFLVRTFGEAMRAEEQSLVPSPLLMILLELFEHSLRAGHRLVTLHSDSVEAQRLELGDQRVNIAVA